jgi:hypothetical protein
MRKSLLAFAFLLVATTAHAQSSVSVVNLIPALSPCLHVVANSQGSSGQDITIDATASGIKVADNVYNNTPCTGLTTPNACCTGSGTGTCPGRCGGFIKNTGTAAMRCRATADGVVTATAGIDIQPGEKLTFGAEWQGPWNCIRETANSTTANVSEDTP